MRKRCLSLLIRLNEWADGHSRLLGLALGVLLSALLALYNVSAGPLHNLFDIGGWANRSLFICMTAVVHALLLGLMTALHRGSFARLALRQGMLTFALYMLLMGINQKSYFYVTQVQPLVRAMDTQGLFAAVGAKLGFSAPAMTLLYLVTRGPVYDMYLVKLLCIAAFLMMALCMLYTADRKHLGLRTESIFLLCLILPQGFMNAGCTALMDVAAVSLLLVALTLLAHNQRDFAWVLGAAIALSGISLLALPVCVCVLRRRGQHLRVLLPALLLPVLLCVPAMCCGMPIEEALTSLLRANLGEPAYAAGSPGLISMIPRVSMEEMPEYFMLRQIPALDQVTNVTEYYTQTHFDAMIHGFTLIGLAGYAGLCAMVYRVKTDEPIRRALTLTLGALLVCPGITSGAWLLADMLCIYALLTAPRLRLPACMILFATAAGSCYPLTEETLLPMIAGFFLCLTALLMLLEVVPGAPHTVRIMQKEEAIHG